MALVIGSSDPHPVVADRGAAARTGRGPHARARRTWISPRWLQQVRTAAQGWVRLGPVELVGYSVLLAGALVASLLVFEFSPVITPAHHEARSVPMLAEGWDPETGEPTAHGGGFAGSTAIVVHVAGAVRQPGVYHLEAGARVADAIGAAGGALVTADVTTINLARALNDAEQVIVDYRTGTTGAAGFGATADGMSANGSPGTTPAGGNGLVDLNRADAQQLTALPGIGPSRAAAIVEYRQTHGPFRVPGDLRAVAGIGESTFQNLADRVTVR